MCVYTKAQDCTLNKNVQFEGIRNVFVYIL